MTIVEPDSPLPVRTLIANTLLGALPAEGLDALCAAAMVRHYKRNTLLCAAGRAVKHVWLVNEGRIEIFYRRTDGQESMVGAFGSSHWCVWVALFAEQPLNQDISAAAGSTLISVPAVAMRRVLAEHASIYPLLIAEIAVRMQLLMQWVGQSAVGNSEQRLAGLLHALGQLENRHESPRCLRASQTRLAQALGMHRHSVSKGLDALQGRGLIRAAYSRIELLDPDGLCDFSLGPANPDGQD
ncbi:MAG: Crp/Fnr family transcriptional regulator [Paucibacter sp.]|nr:Crp/Fnr family transcriptional regulator [Roseateles sp.]